MKNVEEMTIEECVCEVEKMGGIVNQSALMPTMDGADAAIRAAGYLWFKFVLLWVAEKDDGSEKMVSVSPTKDNALDLWRLAVLVYRAKSSSGGGA